MNYPYFNRTNDRELPADYDGEVMIWDIDKTYLDTQFSSMRGLLRIPFEFAVDKRAVPGTVPLLRALRRGPSARSSLTPLYFVSGSPPQLRRVVERKMLLDGVQFDGITFKDQWGLLKARRAGQVKAQMGYKVLALLYYLRELPQGAKLVCFGDDVEEDADIFRLLLELCVGLSQASLEDKLRVGRVESLERNAIMALHEELFGDGKGRGDVVDIYVHLARRSDPDRFGEEVFATKSFLQTALLCAERGRIKAEDITAVAEDLRRQLVSEEDIEAHLEDAALRFGVDEALLEWGRKT